MRGAVGDHAVAFAIREYLIEWVFSKTSLRAFEDSENEDPERTYVCIYGKGVRGLGVRVRVEDGCGILQQMKEYRHGWVVEDEFKYELADPQCWLYFGSQLRKWLSRA